ncbi:MULTISPECIES: helix-turn-helix transcriptional regulator [unclassified Fibrobacter]|uniref:helix-turn-helix domain-containing protein n=1 Tax=unclassified Fibrobacter TaxID=2634177 RepID=UPI000D6B09B6|nr:MULTISPECIES: helix-turn-helix transcriptional regulator [unclassified Fibrobacter]
MDEFFEILQKRREALGLSQKDLSEMSGVSLRTINAIENGNANPSIEVLCKLSNQLGLKLSLTERVVNG